ncbi:RNA polymerase sigma factor [Streptomyces sp. HUAS TT7]|uniref:RNA polymerase sigma factor n=1 Tax=Streptomyces sp. HUAS TT7 TaxID=3447507 RepID=UPI003F6559B2
MSEPNPADGGRLTPSAVQGASSDTLRRLAVDEEFSAFYRATMRPLIQFLVNQGSNVHLAADIAQETMSRAYRRWVEIEQPRAWVHRVASRALVRHISRAVEDPTDTVPEPSSLVPRPDALTAWETGQSTLRVLQALPPRQYQVLAWTLSGYTPTEIAAELGMSPEAVRSSLKKARRAATRHLEQNGEHQ